MRRVMLCVGLLLVMASTVRAQDPCATTPTGTVVNPSSLYATLPEQTVNEVDGLPRVTDYQVAYFAPGNTTSPLVLPVTIPKTAFVAVAGFPTCYKTPLAPTMPSLVGPLVAGLKARRAARAGVDAGESPYAISNPFGTAPDALAAPGRVVVGQ